MAMFLARIKKALNLGTKSITANGTYTASSDGYEGYSQVSVAVPDPPSITPSNVSPIAITANSSVKFSRDGYAIQSYSSKTPDDSNPPSVSSGSIIKVSSYSGYLYKTQQSGVDISNIIDVATTTIAQSTRKNAIYTVGISVINVKNASTGYAIRFYDSPTASTWFDSVSNNSNKNIDVSNYNVVYFDTASASAVLATVTVKS